MQKRTRPYTPDNRAPTGRWKGSTEPWPVSGPTSASTDRAALIDFLNFYNYERPHAALGHKPPASRVPLATYRLTAEGIVVPDIPDRPLQLSFNDFTA